MGGCCPGNQPSLPPHTKECLEVKTGGTWDLGVLAREGPLSPRGGRGGAKEAPPPASQSAQSWGGSEQGEARSPCRLVKERHSQRAGFVLAVGSPCLRCVPRLQLAPVALVWGGVEGWDVLF